MNKLLNFILLSIFISLSAIDFPEVNIGSISFKDAQWDNSSNILFSRQRISEITNQNRAVVLYFFEACFG